MLLKLALHPSDFLVQVPGVHGTVEAFFAHRTGAANGNLRSGLPYGRWLRNGAWHYLGCRRRWLEEARLQTGDGSDRCRRGRGRKSERRDGRSWRRRCCRHGGFHPIAGDHGALDHRAGSCRWRSGCQWRRRGHDGSRRSWRRSHSDRRRRRWWCLHQWRRHPHGRGGRWRRNDRCDR